MTVNREALFTKINEEKFVCPGSNGGKNWPAGAYSPLTNTMYMPLQNMCMTATTTDGHARPVEGLRPQHGASSSRPAPTRSAPCGRSPPKPGKTTWKYEQRAGMLSLVATGGGLVFGGDANGRFKALDDKTGKVLWEMNLGSPVSGYPISVRGRRQAVRRGDHRPVARGQLRRAA